MYLYKVHCSLQINLLSNFSESSDTAVSIFNEKRLIRILLPCLNIDVYGLQIPLVVGKCFNYYYPINFFFVLLKINEIRFINIFFNLAQCLNTVGEENADVNEELSHPLILEQLKAFMVLTPVEPEHVLLKTLAASMRIFFLL